MHINNCAFIMHLIAIPFDRCDIICGLVAWKTNDLTGKICKILCSNAGGTRFKNSIKQ